MLFVAGRLLNPKFSRRYTKLSKPIHEILSHVPSRHRRRAIQEAQQALTDHLHTTRAIHITYAEQITKNSIFSLLNAISKIDFSVANFAEQFSKFLTYHPIDELDFFYESIGIDYKELRLVSPSDQVFITQDFRAFNVACLLFGLGFPWNRLGELYKNDSVIFSMEPKELDDRVLDLKQCGFKNTALVGMCLAFPDLLHIEFDSGHVGVVLDALKFANQLASEQQNLDFWYDLASIIKMVYSIGVEGGNVHSLMDRCKSVVAVHSVEVFIKRVQYFCWLGVQKKDVVMLLLERPELLAFNLKTKEFSILGFLKHFGMSEDKVESVAQDFPYVMGRNKMANLPRAIRAMNLQNWFFDRLKNGNHAFLGSYVMDETDKEADKLYKYGLEKILSSSCAVETMSSKLNTVHSIGFGENEATLRMFYILNKYSTLQESFDCFLDFGADYSRLCRAISCWPSILRQDPNTITEKLGFLVKEMGLSWSYFYNHPECFDYDLDKRIKPRLKFYDWLEEKGLGKKSYSLCKRLKQHDEAFVARVSSIHPAAPKHYFECFAHSPKIRALENNHPNLLKFGCSILSNVPIRYHDRVIQEAQHALMDYLHTTRSIQFTHAEQICKNSTCSLSNVISKMNFSVSTFIEDFVSFLNCHPIDELDFFYESIGFDLKDIPFLSPAHKILNGEEFNALNVACALHELGFPWNRLGELYNGGIFSKEPKQLTDRILYLKSYGFQNIAVVGMCLAFPELLWLGSESGDTDFLLNDFKRVYQLTTDVHQVLDSSYDLFRKINLLYGIGFEKGELCNLANMSRIFFINYSEDVLTQRIEYFCKLGVGGKDVAVLLLKSPEVIGFDLTTPEFSVLGFLKHFGMDKKELKSITVEFPHVLGRHKMANMPCVMRALELQNWFFNKMKNGSHELLGNYATEDSDIDKDYTNGLNQIRLSKSRIRALRKLKFLHGIGFGENKLTMKLLPRLGGHYARLQDRFNCFIDLGANYSKICEVILRVPAIMNNEPDAIIDKVNYLCNEMGLSMSDLYKFPLYLETDLDRQINPRYRFREWLINKGLSTKPFSLVTLITTKGPRFVGIIFRIHPAAPKHYLESFLYREI
ncbi:hypothetical protein QQ045_007733 [Rhodiola kirilowii]